MTHLEADLLLFEADRTELLGAIRRLGHGTDATPAMVSLLTRCGLAEGGDISEAGRALFHLAWVAKDETEASAALGDALRALNPVQVIEQELRGFGAVAEDGVLDLLKLHRAAPSELSIDALRKTLRLLNALGVIAYSQKYKTVRVLPPRDDAAVVGEDRRLAGIVSPRTPFSNIVRLRRILRSLSGDLWWVDPHFSARAFEDLVDELDSAVVSALRILSGDAQSVTSEKAAKDFARFQAEMAGKGIQSEWRVDGRNTRDWHDRWLVDDKSAYNMPPVNTLYKGDWSEMLPSSQRPPVADWWARATSAPGT